jgi:hypothetical protein
MYRIQPAFTMDYSTNMYRSTAISWTLHAMKSLLGLKTVRNKIIKKFYPVIKNIAKSETFDAFQSPAALVDYCTEIMHYQPYVVFTASNQAEDTAEPETHYQTFYLDNVQKHLYMIDPSRKNNADGIYTPFIARDTIQPFYEKHGYVCEFIEMTNPAQSCVRDVFCQSWSLYILVNFLQDGLHNVPIPRNQMERYTVLLNFYQVIMHDLPTLKKELQKEYISELQANKNLVLADGTDADYHYLLTMDPVSLLWQMQAEDML